MLQGSKMSLHFMSLFPAQNYSNSPLHNTGVLKQVDTIIKTAWTIKTLHTSTSEAKQLHNDNNVICQYSKK